MDSVDEPSLIKSARAFDHSVLGVIYDRYSPMLYRYAMRLLGDQSLAEECVAETFSRFLKSLRAGQGPENHLQAYLFRIAHNWITDAYRNQTPLSLELMDSLPGEEGLPVENQVSTTLEIRQVQMALRSLTSDQRVVISLRFLEGWSHEEVAVVLKKPVGAIRALQLRALNRLRELLLVDE